MKTKPTPNQYLAEAQARELSRQFGYAYLVKTRVGLYLAAIGVIPSETILIKFENGKKVALLEMPDVSPAGESIYNF